MPRKFCLESKAHVVYTCATKSRTVHIMGTYAVDIIVIAHLYTLWLLRWAELVISRNGIRIFALLTSNVFAETSVYDV